MIDLYNILGYNKSKRIGSKKLGAVEMIWQIIFGILAVAFIISLSKARYDRTQVNSDVHKETTDETV